MRLTDAFRSTLVTLDVKRARRMWGEVCPHLPQPKTDAEMLVQLHLARTSANSIPLRLRAYSHRWLLDHGHPSLLPDSLKSKAEQLCPKVVSAVGLSVNSKVPELKRLVHEAMSNAVLEAIDDGKLDDSDHVKRRMDAARHKALDDFYR
jgi:hypothetical protein